MKSLITLIFICSSLLSFGQELTNAEMKKFQKGEKALLEYMYMFAYDTIPFETKVKNIHAFIPRFIGLLKEKNSYLYPFDSLLIIQKVKAPDDAFKIFTWELKEPLGTHRYYGAIQQNSSELKLTPLFDYSDTMEYHPQKVLSPNNWYGCMYYNCVLTTDKLGTKKYTLFGIDRADFVSNRKIVEVLTMDKDSISFGEESLLEYYDTLGRFIERKNRLFLEYNDRAVIHLNYNEQKQEIVYDHTTPPSEGEKDAEFTYIPDGTYEGFRWVDDVWKYIYRVFTFSIGKNDSPPIPMPQNKKSKKNIFGR